MAYLESHLFRRFPELSFGFSLRFGAAPRPPYHFNMSYSVGDDERLVTANRDRFFRALGLRIETVAYQRQVHGDRARVVSEGGDAGESDALLTDRPGLGLAISSADCCAAFFYDPRNAAIGAAHAGWRGAEKRIVAKTVAAMREEFRTDPDDLRVYLAPSISQEAYEVGPEVAERFDERRLLPVGDKFLLDVAGVNRDLLLAEGVRSERIQRAALCSFQCANLFHSYRRDGERSGRALGVVAIRPNQ
jgi:polyphenol oxidase